MKKASDTGEALKGNATTFDIELYNRTVKKFQQVSVEIVSLIDIMLERRGLNGAALAVVNDKVVDDTFAGELEVKKTQVETSTSVALEKVRKETDRVECEKIKLTAERTEQARVEIMNGRAENAGADPNAVATGNTQPTNRVTRFQATESARKPEIMDTDDKNEGVLSRCCHPSRIHP